LIERIRQDEQKRSISEFSRLKWLPNNEQD
jgi:hypothetical protein